jgi:hemolysin activation/secretion protein
LKYKSLVWALYGISLASGAQTVPGAGVFQQQIDKERRVELPKAQPAGARQVPAPLQVQGELVVEVREFRFAGNKLMDNAALSGVLSGYLDRPLDWNQLRAAAASVAQAYRDRGWVARAYLPEQDIENGVVTIQIVEAVFGGIQFDAAEQPARVAREKIQAIFDAQIQPGETIAQQKLERALLVSDDLPGVAVAGALSEGDAVGQTLMKIKLTDEPFTSGDVTLDNTGSRSTGRNRAVANLQMSSPSGIGDQLSLLGLFTEGTRYARAGYTLPLGANGLRIGVNGSYLGYKVITHDVPDDLRGTSTVLGLEASYPILRARMNNLYLSLAADHKGFDNQRNLETSTKYNSNVYSIGFNGNSFDNFMGGGANSGGVTLSAGRLNNQVQSEAMQGQFSKLRYQVRRQQVVTNNLSIAAMFSGQWANRSLDSSEKFYLGGASGVRAYPTSEGGGSLGQMLNLDVRQQLPNGLNAGVFYDWGQFKDPTGGTISRAMDLKGWGLSLGWQAESGLSLRSTWARRIGNNPNPTASGNDQDGTLIRDRFWLTAAFPF